MKYLFLTNYFYPETFRGNDIAFELSAKGHDVTVLTCIPNYPEGHYLKGYTLFKRRREIISGVKVIRVPVIPRGEGGKMGMILNYLSGCFFLSIYALHHAMWYRYDSVFVQQLSPAFIGIPALIIKKIQKIPVFLWILDLWPESLAAGGISNKRVMSYIKKIVDWIYTSCDKVLISSAGFRSALHERGVENSKIIYFPNWYDGGEKTMDSDYLLPAFPSGFIIMFAGNLGEAQNLENILQVALQLSHLEELKWVFVGDGRKRIYLEEFIMQHNLQHKIFLVGRHPITTMPLFFNKANIMLVSLSDNSAFNLTLPAKIQAYMATKKPILGMLNGEGQMIINQSQCGYAVGADDIDAMVVTITDILAKSQEELSEMGLNGYEYYLANYQKNHCMEHLHNILNKP